MNKLFRVAAIAALVIAALSSRAAATPAEEITRAAIVNGGSVNSGAFLVAFGSVLARVKSRQLGDYVRAAFSLRPDLQNEILNTALTVRASSNPRVRQAEVASLVRAALSAAKERVTELIISAIQAHPDQRNAIAVAAGSAAPPHAAAFQFVALHSGFSHETGSASDTAQGEHHHRKHPADDDDEDEVSPEKPPRDG